MRKNQHLPSPLKTWWNRYWEIPIWLAEFKVRTVKPITYQMTIHSPNKNHSRVFNWIWHEHYNIYWHGIVLSLHVRRRNWSRFMNINIVNTVLVDTLAPCPARTSATMILTMQNMPIFVLHVRITIMSGMPLWSNDIKWKYMFIFALKNLARKVLIIAYSSATRW